MTRIESMKLFVALRMASLAPALIVICLSALVALPGAWAFQEPEQDEAGPQVSHRARSLQPGEVVVLEVAPPSSGRTGGEVQAQSSRMAIEDVRAAAFGREVSGHPTGQGRWEVLLGIDLGVAAGTYPVELTVALMSPPGGRDSPQAYAGPSETAGRKVQIRYPLEVADKQFPTRRLKVAPKYVEPPPETRARIAAESRLLGRLFKSATGERLWTGEFAAPVAGRVNPDSFGKRSVFNGQPRSPHSGADFPAPRGTPVRAPNSGKVVLVRDLYFAGQTVIVDHGLGLYTYLAHLSEFKVEEGQTVERGDVLGLSGATGRVTGPHLHYSVRLNNAKVDPLALMEIVR